MSVDDRLNESLHVVENEARGDGAEPVPGDSSLDDLAATRDALLTTYRELLAQVRGLAGDPRRADELARLAEAAGKLVHGEFVRRLVFGEHAAGHADAST